MEVPKSHPRYLSLMARNKVVKGIERGITSLHGLISQGRGEAFDYLIGEKTQPPAKKAIEAAACLLLTAKHPIISVNGNAAALVPEELVRLSKIIPAKLEVNLFHASWSREIKIGNHLIKNGANEVLLPHKSSCIPHLDHNRRFCNEDGILKADVVFVPLEDGDRCKALEKMGKKVITIDLNPLSRTSKTATITIVDNITRALPLLIKTIKKYSSLKENQRKIKEFPSPKSKNFEQLKNKLKKYDNKKILRKPLKTISKL